MTESGWSNSLVCMEYSEQHFMKHVTTKEHPMMIMFDGQKSHINLNLSKWGETKKRLQQGSVCGKNPDECFPEDWYISTNEESDMCCQPPPPPRPFNAIDHSRDQEQSKQSSKDVQPESFLDSRKVVKTIKRREK
ncbi:hypothetical protein MAR_015900, partial [Mya arenaria]